MGIESTNVSLSHSTYCVLNMSPVEFAREDLFPRSEAHKTISFEFDVLSTATSDSLLARLASFPQVVRTLALL